MFEKLIRSSRSAARAGALGLALGSTIVLGACGGDDDDEGGDRPATSAPTNAGGIPSNLTKVAVSDSKFTPTNLQVPAGANVTWEWSGTLPHSVTGTFEGEQILSPKLTGTGVFLFAFQKAGTFSYQCGVHGEAMKGTITVK